ncbi:MAG: alginate O-acetyltransferase AlgX-related protein [Planctomycetota bacterium]|jgi:hypothetical protein
MARRIQNITNDMLILAFIIWIYIPIFGSVLGWDFSNTLGEKRTLAQCPVLGIDPIKTIPDKFESFYEDHFGFRNGLIRSHNWIRYKLFKGASYGKVFFGKGDWLFLAKSGTIADYLGQGPLTSDELDIWKNKLEQRQRWLSGKGIRYLFVIAPNKLTIYPEMLPDHVGKFKGQTRMDQLIYYLNQNSTIKLLDLRDALQEAKKTALVYHVTDTHWTDRGGFVTYLEISKHLAQWFPDIQHLMIDNFSTAIQKHQGDLAVMLGLGEELAEECETFHFRKPQEASYVDFVINAQYPHLKQMLNNNKLAMENKNGTYRLLFLHDSFGEHGKLKEYLSEQFSRSVCVPVTLDNSFLKSITEQEKPDIVIEEIAERKLRDIPSLD